MIVRSEGKNVLDGGANPPISTKLDSYYYTEHEWSTGIGWGTVPDYRNKSNTGMNSFDKAQSTQTDDPKDD